ncbi:Rgg/GadR/MutR family transcriptional regulator [Lactococcus lactis subsp. lactis]|uniref:Rgg/GadR/MutR family transcriptional regulator n=1 Tax=Lactococcus lactis TaxID=1358 RepID=UPI00223BD789|nr:Rgg/GadR/MutR family transcriptional regulator [Lactococcus lactis]MCT0017752.1 Rgg/GadR/MutR family transcriptional regulator [Lactococcus lactis subsp. lactis]
MIYKRYGKIFKKLRVQKGIKLVDFEKIGISKSTLGKFERGETMIAFDKLVLSLGVLSVTLGEYEGFLNNFEADIHEVLLKKIDEARILNQSENLVELYKSAQELSEFPLALAIKNEYDPLTGNDLEGLVNYLETISLWRMIDLYTFYLVLDSLTTREISYILDQFLIDKHIIFNSENSRIRFAHVAYYRAISLLISRGNKERSHHILRYIESNDFKHNMYTNNLRNLVEGYWISEFDDYAKGLKQMKDALKIFHDLSDFDVSQYYQRMYKIFSERRGN